MIYILFYRSYYFFVIICNNLLSWIEAKLLHTLYFQEVVDFLQKNIIY